MIFVHDLQSSRILQQWFKLSSILQFLDVISSTNKLASNEHPWNLEIKHNIHKLSNTCSRVQWVVEPGVSRSRQKSHIPSRDSMVHSTGDNERRHFNTLLRRSSGCEKRVSVVIYCSLGSLPLLPRQLLALFLKLRESQLILFCWNLGYFLAFRFPEHEIVEWNG